MGDTAVDIFQETLKQLITSSELSLVIAEKHQLQSLDDEIKYLRGFLKDTEKKRKDHSEVMELVMQIRELVYEAENIVDLFVVHASKVDHAPYSLLEHQDHLSLDLDTVKKGMKTLTGKVKKIYDKNMYEINEVAVKERKHFSTGIGGWRNGKLIGKPTVDWGFYIFPKGLQDVPSLHKGEVQNPYIYIRKNVGGSGSSKEKNTSKVVKGTVVVGFEEEVKRVIDKLDRGENKPLEIISIIGAGGAGKTTLAREVYDHPFTSYIFEIRAWVDVSQDYDKTSLLIHILKSAFPEKNEEDEDYEKSRYEKLGEDTEDDEDFEKHINEKVEEDAQRLMESAKLEKNEEFEKRRYDKLQEHTHKCLKGRKYLIVMDDVWGIEAWNDIGRAFPKECKGSKVLFTSRQLVKLDSVGYVPHYLDSLPKKWCWELLQKKVFGTKYCPPELVEIGEQIAEKCQGLPLAIVTIAGILATEDKTLDVWKKVAKHLSSIIAKKQEGCMEILELSYNHLPLHLKPCFLYIGGYPEDNEISVRELIWLWIAEGFIHGNEGGKSLETIAKDYLIGLIDRSLVQVAKKSSLGGIKTCRIHDLLRELCLKKAEDDNFLLKVYEDDSFSPSAAFATNNHRRLFISRQFLQKFTLRPQNLRSFLCLSSVNSYQSLVETNLSFFAENFFKLLRVFSFISGTCHGEIGTGQLVHLRYLAFTFDWYGLPFSYLSNLETLNLHSTFIDTIQLPRYTFKMVKLRHLYTKNGIFNFHLYSEEAGQNGFDSSSKLDSLQTLHRVCSCEVCRSLLVRIPNLRKLGLEEGEIPEDNVLRFPDPEFIKCLETLTLTVKKSHTDMKRTLPPGLKLPLTITRIIFKRTCLKWEELSLLQTLPNLEVLKLIQYACCGPVWNISEFECFPQLKYLRFFNLDIKEWNASEDQFPKLEVLVIELCEELERIPIDFGYLNELREIKLEGCRRSAEESAREIQKEQRNRIGDDDCLNLLAKYNYYGPKWY